MARNNHNGNNTAERTWQNVVMTQSENKLAQRWQKRKNSAAGGWLEAGVRGAWQAVRRAKAARANEN